MTGPARLYLFSLVSKEEYTRTLMSRLLKGYFNNSFPALASFFAKENDLSIKEMDELLEEGKKDLEKTTPKNNVGETTLLVVMN